MKNLYTPSYVYSYLMIYFNTHGYLCVEFCQQLLSHEKCHRVLRNLTNIRMKKPLLFNVTLTTKLEFLSEKLENFYQNTWYHALEDSILYSQHCDVFRFQYFIGLS
jgi:hypothetical protein